MSPREPLPATPPSPTVEAWLPAFVADSTRAATIDEWVERTTSAILAEVSEAERDPDFAGGIRDAVREHWLAFLAELAQPEPTFHLPEAAERLAGEVAERQLPLATLIKIYRVAQQASWSYVTGVVDELTELPAEAHTEVLVYFWTRAGSWIDASIGSSIDVYQDERDRISRNVAARHYDAARAVLSGELADVRRASAELGGYAFSVFHTAFLLRSRREEGVAALERLAARLAGAIGGTRPLVVQPGGGQVWCWAGTPSEPDLDGLRPVAHELEALGVHAAVGSPAWGIEGFVVSHEEAGGAQQVALRQPHPSPITAYHDVELLVLLGDSPAVSRYVARQLGDLVRDDASTGRLRETVATFLRLGGSIDGVAQELAVHPNTVRNRLSQAADLIGRPPSRFDADLAAALRHHEAFAPRVDEA